MSDGFQLALVLDGRAVSALVVGGGPVAERKVHWLLDGGADVRVVALSIGASLEKLASEQERLSVVQGAYAVEAIADATLVVAATDDAVLNQRIARDARQRRCLVVVADAPGEGNCITPAVHRAGSLLVAVSAGGLPRAAARVRDAISARFDQRYAAAMLELRGLRRRLLEAGQRARWQQASDQLVGEEFCELVERGVLVERMTPWL